MRGLTSLACVTGRFQPVHAQHLELFELALADCDHLVVAVTNPDAGARHREPTSSHRHTAAANPFTYFERCRLLAAAAQGQGLDRYITTVPFDLTRPELWPQYVPLAARQFVRAYSDWEREKGRRLQGAGYRVTLLEGDAATRTSASDIRAALAAGGSGWRPLVPAATIALLEELLQRTPMVQRS